ncbi:hypothetical protein BABINDRAFT_162331 [Babjeviella inositovora NRRL Y-12698]|uniref:Uncharacterized protein n=1 Tax=Babjeviella inositovora NRRL Y-12698 TaxID=984486 RepID=A0A1E3QLX0_9ASCO|nr:uncharacterized protein BABINDRAFT_162331 [Babjeviella inositovora NRRL Y-12698]ODQ78618.1 hypothetical protein BABINDRAFT_162331 [Babjeviella inositovora NRRL Y-12698]
MIGLTTFFLNYGGAWYNETTVEGWTTGTRLSLLYGKKPFALLLEVFRLRIRPSPKWLPMGRAANYLFARTF